MKTFNWLFLITIIPFSANAQLLNPGQQCPDIISTEVINHNEKIFRLSSLKGKLIVFDFWNHSCITCVRDFSRLDSLQKQFKDKIQIILVCREGRDSTLRFFAKRKKIRMPDVPLITNEAAAWSLFTKDKTPFQAWVDTAGRFLFKTGSYNLTATNISRYLEGRPLAIKDRSQLQRTLSATNTTVTASPLFHSRISHCDPETYPAVIENMTIQEGRATRIHIPHSSILKLYCTAYKEFNRYRFSTTGQVILNVRDSFRFQQPVATEQIDDWEARHCYDYELIIPAKFKSIRYRYMQEDLQRFFGLKAVVEKRMVRALVLRRTSNQDNLRSRGGSPVDSLVQSSNRLPVNDSIRVFRNKPFNVFVNRLTSWINYHCKLQFVNETGYEGNIDIRLREISIDPLNLAELRKDLQTYGLELVEGETCADVLVLTEENSPQGLFSLK